MLAIPISHTHQLSTLGLFPKFFKLFLHFCKHDYYVTWSNTGNTFPASMMGLHDGFWYFYIKTSVTTNLAFITSLGIRIPSLTIKSGIYKFLWQKHTKLYWNSQHKKLIKGSKDFSLNSFQKDKFSLYASVPFFIPAISIKHDKSDICTLYFCFYDLMLWRNRARKKAQCTKILSQPIKLS